MGYITTKPFLAFIPILLLFETGIASPAMPDETIYTELSNTLVIKCRAFDFNNEFKSVQWTKSTVDDVYVNGDPAIAAWDGGSEFHTVSNYNIANDGSLVVRNITVENLGIFQCKVITTDSDPSLQYVVKIASQKHPDSSPLLSYSIIDSDIIFNCSMGPVFPLQYPDTFFTITNKSKINHQNGTYITSISFTFPRNENYMVVSCWYTSGDITLNSSLPVTESIITATSTDAPKFTEKFVSTDFAEPCPRKIGYTSNSIVLAICVSAFLSAFTTCVICLAIRKCKDPKMILNWLKSRANHHDHADSTLNAAVGEKQPTENGHLPTCKDRFIPKVISAV